MESRTDYEAMGLDARVIPMVQFFNDNGLKTALSCQGHEDVNMSLFWIQFDESITEDDVADFMWKHRTKFDMTEAPEKYRRREGYDRWFISNRRIAERLLVSVEGRHGRCWMYVAASPEAAEDDLEIWKRAERGETFQGHRKSGGEDNESDSG